MSLVNNSANNFKDFLDAIKPFLNYQFYDLSGQGVEANNFSTDEKVIGTWIDGKPLYQKTFEWTYANGSLIPDAGSLVIPNTADIKCICDGCLKYTDTGGNTDYTPIATTFPDSETVRNQWSASFSNIGVASQRIGFRLGSGWKQNTYTNIRISVTMKYTKTTDTAVASGEKIVGQWIDGKPVYENTIIVENPTSTGTSIQYAHNISNFGELIDIKGITQLSTSAISANIYIGADFHSMISADNTYLYYNMKWGQTSITKLSATLRYTKTTD